MAYGEGATLQEAADDLVARVLVLVMAFRSSGIGPVSGEGPMPDLAMLDFLYELGEIASANGVSRLYLFHHKPGRSDQALADIREEAQKSFKRTDTASEETSIDV